MCYPSSLLPRVKRKAQGILVKRPPRAEREVQGTLANLPPRPNREAQMVWREFLEPLASLEAEPLYL